MNFVVQILCTSMFVYSYMTMNLWTKKEIKKFLQSFKNSSKKLSLKHDCGCLVVDVGGVGVITLVGVFVGCSLNGDIFYFVNFISLKNKVLLY